MWWKEKGKKEDNNLQQYNNKVCAPFLSCCHTPLCITIELLVVCPPTWTGCSLLRVRSMGILVVLAECSGVFSSLPRTPPSSHLPPPFTPYLSTSRYCVRPLPIICSNSTAGDHHQSPCLLPRTWSSSATHTDNNVHFHVAL